MMEILSTSAMVVLAVGIILMMFIWLALVLGNRD